MSGRDLPAGSLAERVREALTDDGPPWLPAVGRDLASECWASLESMTGLNAETYGTRRMLARHPREDRIDIAALQLPPPFRRSRPVLVESLPSLSAREYVELDLSFAPAHVASSETVLGPLRGAIDQLAGVTNLAEVVGGVLSTVHVLVPEGEEFDVSYSDPKLPFSSPAPFDET